MRQLSIHKNTKGKLFFLFTFDYNPDVYSYIKQIPTAEFKSKTKSWVIDANFITVKYVDVFYQYFNFTIDDYALSIINELIKPIETIQDFPEIKGTLRDFQKEGISKGLAFKKVLLADDMGLGKTAESISIVEKANAYPCIVICPSSVKINWQREIDKWVNRTSVVIYGKKISSYKKNFVIINYEMLKHHIKNFIDMGYKSIIVDEAHYCKNAKSNRTILVRNLVKKAEYRLLLTGTPVLNKPQELISQLDMLGVLKYFGGFWKFAKRYCDAKQGRFGWDFSGKSNLKELNIKLREFCMIRRLKADVAKELPDKQRTFIPLDVSLIEYNKVKNNFVKWLNEEYLRTDNIKAVDESKINQNANFTERQKHILLKNKLNIGQSEALIKLEYLKQTIANAKIEKFLEWVDNLIETGEKLVIFANHVNIQNILCNRLSEKYKVAKLFSEDSDEMRQVNIDLFQCDDEYKIFVGSLAAAGVGITLTAASNVAFIEFGWTSAIHDQAEDRCHRLGQKDSVNCYYFYVEDTIDTQMLNIIEEKRKVSHAIIDGIDYIPTGFDINSIINQFFD